MGLVISNIYKATQRLSREVLGNAKGAAQGRREKEQRATKMTGRNWRNSLVMGIDVDFIDE